VLVFIILESVVHLENIILILNGLNIPFRIMSIDEAKNWLDTIPCQDDDLNRIKNSE